MGQFIGLFLNFGRPDGLSGAELAHLCGICVGVLDCGALRWNVACFCLCVWRGFLLMMRLFRSRRFFVDGATYVAADWWGWGWEDVRSRRTAWNFSLNGCIWVCVCVCVCVCCHHIMLVSLEVYQEKCECQTSNKVPSEKRTTSQQRTHHFHILVFHF